MKRVMKKPLEPLVALKNWQSGVSMLELLISISLAMILLSSLFVLYYGAARGAAKEESRSLAYRENQVLTRQMSREFQLVGLLGPEDCDGDSNDINRDVPGQTWSDSSREDFEYANMYELVFTGDVDNDSTTETIRIFRDPATLRLKTTAWEWSTDSVRWLIPRTRNLAGNVDFLMFAYYDKDGNRIPSNSPPPNYTLNAGERRRITSVEVTIVTRSATAETGYRQYLNMPDGSYWYDGYRRVVNRFMVRGRNLSLGA